jgi:hypothetical protein
MKRLARCQRHELLVPANQEPIWVDDEPARRQLVKGREGGIDLALVASLQDLEINPLRPRSFPNVSHYPLYNRVGWVHQQGDNPRLGNQLGQKFELLGMVGSLATTKGAEGA